MRRRRQSSCCRDLNDGVCRMSERRIIRRFSEEAVEVCNKVGLPPNTEAEDYDNAYTEDYDNNMFDHEVVESEFDSESMHVDENYATTSSSCSSDWLSDKSGSYAPIYVPYEEEE